MKLLYLLLPMLAVGLTVTKTGFVLTDQEIEAPVNSLLGYASSIFKVLIDVLGVGGIAAIMLIGFAALLWRLFSHR